MKNDDIKTIENLSLKKNEYLIRWQMTTLCNYYCDFCIQGNKDIHVKKAKGENSKTRNKICEKIIQLIEEKLNDKYQNLIIDLIGGEITILPDFTTILEKFINCKFKGNIKIHITTNLSADINILKQIKKSIKNKKNRRLSISASFYKEFTTEEEFIKRVKIFTNSIDNNKLIRKIRKKILKRLSNIIFAINIPLIEDEDYNYYLYFKEKYKNIVNSINYIHIIKYSKSISDKLKKELVNNNDKKIKITLKDNSIKYYSRTSKISLDIIDSEFFNPHGFLCDSGINNISIDNFGNISRCHSCLKLTNIGNILESNFDLITEKFRCPSYSCNCDKYGIIENDKN